MCGIAGVFLRKKSVVEKPYLLERMIDELFLNIEQRGKHATGYVAVTKDGDIQVDKSAVSASEFIADREPLPDFTKAILLHCRFTTKGTEKENVNNHPVIYNTCFVTHNGTINNDDELFEKLKFKRNGEVDTEIISALLNQQSSDFDLEKVVDTLKELDGSAAIAAIDPLNAPDKVLLARTYSSPLVVIDKGAYVVWASTEEAMTKAWGNTIGTPPNTKHFKLVPVRKALLVTDEGIDVKDIPYKSFYKPQENHQHRHVHSEGWGNLHEQMWCPIRDFPANQEYPYGVIPTDTEIKDMVAAARAEGKRETTVWENRKGQVGNKWMTCHICNQLTAEEELLRSTRGTICLDCKKAWFEFTRGEAVRMKEQKESGEDDTLPVIPTLPETNEYASLRVFLQGRDAPTFNAWAQDEDYTHVETLREMSKNLSLDVEALDFLMFRADTMQLMDVPGLLKFVREAVKMYNRIYMDIWDWMGEDTEEDGFGINVLRVTIKQPSPPVVVVAQKKSKPIPFAVPTAPKKNSCCFCKSKARVRVHDEGHNFDIDYCTKHFNKCHVRGCKNDTNHTGLDCVRRCHLHSRAMKGYSDTTLQGKGVKVGVAA